MAAAVVQEVVISDIYQIEKKLGTGRWGNIHLATHSSSGSRIALKIFPRPQIKQADFVREYNMSYFLSSAQPNIITTYEGMFSCPQSWFFVQEISPCGSLRDIVNRGRGLSEDYAKKVLSSVVSALEFIHKKDLVHRNIQAKNVLIFDPNFSRLKVADFGLTRKEGTMVKHFDIPNVYHAQELCETCQKEMYSVDQSVDMWAVGVLMFNCLRGNFPWEQAKFSCPAYESWKDWVKGKNLKLPPQFSPFSDRFMKFFKKTLHPRPDDRYSAKDVRKYLKVAWLKDVKGNEDAQMHRSLSEKQFRADLTAQQSTEHNDIVSNGDNCDPPTLTQSEAKANWFARKFNSIRN